MLGKETRKKQETRLTRVSRSITRVTLTSSTLEISGKLKQLTKSLPLVVPSRLLFKVRMLNLEGVSTYQISILYTDSNAYRSVILLSGCIAKPEIP